MFVYRRFPYFNAGAITAANLDDAENFSAFLTPQLQTGEATPYISSSLSVYLMSSSLKSFLHKQHPPSNASRV